MFRASLFPSSGEQDHVLPHMVFCTGCAGCCCVELGRKHTVHCLKFTVCSPDDGHNDARNILRYKFDNKHLISCILLVSLSSPYVHDARSQEPKILNTFSLP